jgi:hypothetical protein
VYDSLFFIIIIFPHSHFSAKKTTSKKSQLKKNDGYRFVSLHTNGTKKNHQQIWFHLFLFFNLVICTIVSGGIFIFFFLWGFIHEFKTFYSWGVSLFGLDPCKVIFQIRKLKPCFAYI